MAQKDASQKILESYNDVFSDIVNVLLFNGRKVLAEEELEDQAPRSYYKADGKIHEIERNGRYGNFMGCSNYPKCRYVQKI